LWTVVFVCINCINYFYRTLLINSFCYQNIGQLRFVGKKKSIYNHFDCPETNGGWQIWRQIWRDGWNNTDSRNIQIIYIYYIWYYYLPFYITFSLEVRGLYLLPCVVYNLRRRRLTVTQAWLEIRIISGVLPEDTAYV